MINTANYFAKRGDLYYNDLSDIKNMCSFIQDQFDVKYHYSGNEVKIQSDEVTAWSWTQPSSCHEYIHVKLPTENNVIMSRQEAKELRDCLTSLLWETK